MSDLAPQAVTVYSADSPHTTTYRRYVADVWRARHLLVSLGRASNKAEHLGTALGRIWFLLDPLLFAGVYFVLVTAIRPHGDGSDALRHFSLIMSGLFFYHYLRGAAGSGANSLLRGQRLILNSTFPRAVLPLSSVYAAATTFPYHLVIYAAIHVTLGQPIGWGVLFVPVLFASLTVFAAGAALLFSVLSVEFRDARNLLPFVMRAWLFLTPILYEARHLSGNVKPIIMANPLYPIFAALQQTVTGGAPSALQLFAGAGSAFGALMIGVAYFVRREKHLALRL